MDGAIRTEPSGRRWRYRFPACKALGAAILLCAGALLCITGFALGQLAVGVVGTLCLLPGAYASFMLMRVWRGDSTVALQWLSVEELPDA